MTEIRTELVAKLDIPQEIKTISEKIQTAFLDIYLINR